MRHSWKHITANMCLLQRAIVLLSAYSLTAATVIPTTYKPSTYNTDKGNGRELRFIQRDPVSAFMNRVNTTYRLFGKTYYVQPDGTRVILPDGAMPTLSEPTTTQETTPTAQPEEAATDMESKLEKISLSSTTESFSLNNILPPDDYEEEMSVSHSTSTTERPEETHTVDKTKEEEQPPKGEDDKEGSGRWKAQELTVEEVVRTSAFVVRARGVATALLDAVAIIYDCVRYHWSSGVVSCMTAKTVTLLDAAARDEAKEAMEGDLEARFAMEDDADGPEEARRNRLKKIFHPFGLALKLKFLLILVGVALLAGKAAILSFGTFAMTLMMYMKKAAVYGHHQDLGHVSVFPPPSFHHQSKRYDDTSTLGNLRGGRRLYM